jgi:hypothetical protein
MPFGVLLLQKEEKTYSLCPISGGDKNYRNNSISGSPVHALGYGTLQSEESVGAISVILTLLETVALLTVQPYQINGTCESYS